MKWTSWSACSCPQRNEKMKRNLPIEVKSALASSRPQPPTPVALASWKMQHGLEMLQIKATHSLHWKELLSVVIPSAKEKELGKVLLKTTYWRKYVCSECCDPILQRRWATTELKIFLGVMWSFMPMGNAVKYHQLCIRRSNLRNVG